MKNNVMRVDIEIIDTYDLSKNQGGTRMAVFRTQSFMKKLKPDVFLLLYCLSFLHLTDCSRNAFSADRIAGLGAESKCFQ